LETAETNAGIPSSKPISRSRVLFAILLIALVVFAATAVYEEYRAASLSHELSSETVSINGTRYYYVSIPITLFNGSQVLFRGVTFTILTMPGELLLPNGRLEGSVRLSNGTLLNLNGKEVSMGAAGGPGMSISIASMQNHTLSAVYYTPIGVSLTFPDGTKVVHTNFNVVANVSGGSYDLTYMILPVVNPWFTLHGNTSAGFFVDHIPPYTPLTLYVSAPS